MVMGIKQQVFIYICIYINVYGYGYIGYINVYNLSKL